MLNWRESDGQHWVWRAVHTKNVKYNVSHFLNINDESCCDIICHVERDVESDNCYDYGVHSPIHLSFKA